MFWCCDTLLELHDMIMQVAHSLEGLRAFRVSRELTFEA